MGRSGAGKTSMRSIIFANYIGASASSSAPGPCRSTRSHALALACDAIDTCSPRHADPRCHWYAAVAAAADRVSGGEPLELTVSLCSRGLAGSRTVPRQPDAQPLGLWRVRAAAASSSSSSWLDAHELVVLHIWSCIWHVRAARRRSWTRTFSARRRTSSATWRC